MKAKIRKDIYLFSYLPAYSLILITLDGSPLQTSSSVKDYLTASGSMLANTYVTGEITSDIRSKHKGSGSVRECSVQI